MKLGLRRIFASGSQLRGLLVFGGLLLAFTAWAFASPVGSSPDDDFHLPSIWCSSLAQDLCVSDASTGTRLVSSKLSEIYCFAHEAKISADCQVVALSQPAFLESSSRGNFQNEYPAGYYTTMAIFASNDVVGSVIAMRLINIFIFIILGVSIFTLLGPSDKVPFLAMWILTMVPLGMFVIASTNPSSWAITALGSGTFALWGALKERGLRSAFLGLLFSLSCLLAAMSRADASVLLVGISILTIALGITKSTLIHKVWLLVLPLLGAVISLSGSLQLTSATTTGLVAGNGSTDRFSGIGLLAFNIAQFPEYLLGMFGFNGLGWEDTQMPAIVWALVPSVLLTALVLSSLTHKGRSSFVLGLGWLGLLVIALSMFQLSGAHVGAVVQSRYLLPAFVALVGLAFAASSKYWGIYLRRWQLVLALAVLVIANATALFANMSRYLFGQSNGQPLSLDAALQLGNSWWWAELGIGPNLVFLIGSSAFAVSAISLFWIGPLTITRSSAVAQADR